MEATALEKQLIELTAARAATESEKKGLENHLSENLSKREEELKQVVRAPLTQDDDDLLEKVNQELTMINEKIQEVTTSIQETNSGLDEKSLRVRKLQSELDDMKNKEGEQDRLLVSETRAVEKIVSKRNVALQKREDCARKIRDLGTQPANTSE